MTTGRMAVFAGSSLPVADRPDHVGIDWHEPAAAGDLLTVALRDKPAAICLIDGYFDHRPAPWHKEILTALSQGIAVFGGSSMGALRASELGEFGMVGVGTIYRAYAAGLLTGDDEVALIHAPRELDWAPLSVPMVEVRATLALLVKKGQRGMVEARKARAVVHDIHYADRDWPTIGQSLVASGLGEEIGPLLERTHVPLKRLDARLCLRRALSGLDLAVKPPSVPNTSFLQNLRAELRI